MNLGLGTAQFGSDYGVTNTRGKVPAAEVERILRFAAENGVHVLDTAAAYGEAEASLGSALWQGHPFRIVTKCPGREAREVFLRSLERLRQDSVYGLLAHHAAELNKVVVEQLLDLKREGLVSRIGASFYTGAEILNSSALMTPEIAQVPVSVADQRLVLDGTLARMHSDGVEIHARSVFLQGLLLADPQRIPAPLRHIEAYAKSAGVSQLALALGFLAQVPQVDVALVGVTSVGELQAIVEASRLALERRDLSALAVKDEALLNPSRWPKARADA
jgi:aryl-alcohol dehydrogenase-like predicted oxidoreductase